MGLLVVDLDHHEMNVVQISVDPKHLDDDIKQYSHQHDQAHDSGNASEHDSAKPHDDEQDQSDSE